MNTFNYRPMSIHEMLKVIHEDKVCHFSTSTRNVPYTVPMYYGYKFENDNLTVYFYCDDLGRKLKNMEVNPNVCMNFERTLKCTDFKYLDEVYESVIASGIASVVEDPNEIRDAKTVFYSKNYYNSFILQEMKGSQDITFIKVCVTTLTGRIYML